MEIAVEFSFWVNPNSLLRRADHEPAVLKRVQQRCSKDFVTGIWREQVMRALWISSIAAVTGSRLYADKISVAERLCPGSFGDLIHGLICVILTTTLRP